MGIRTLLCNIAHPLFQHGTFSAKFGPTFINVSSSSCSSNSWNISGLASGASSVHGAVGVWRAGILFMWESFCPPMMWHKLERGCGASARSRGLLQSGLLDSVVVWVVIANNGLISQPCGCVPAGLWEQCLWNRKRPEEDLAREGGGAKAPNGQNSDGSFVFQARRRLPQLLCITTGGFYSKVMSEFP